MNTIKKSIIKKITPFHIWIISLVLIPITFYFFIVTPDTATKAKSGTLNAPYIENHFPVALNGEWEYYDNQFLFMFINCLMFNINLRYYRLTCIPKEIVRGNG